MKLLLTSSGITNKSIADALFELVGKEPENTSIVFIPTASNTVKGDKEWFIEDLVNIQKQHFKQIEIADISAIPEAVWRPKLEEADILFFEGGDYFHLMQWINKSGLGMLLPELLHNKVFVGVSAGSIVTNKNLLLKFSKIIYEDDLNQSEDMAGLGYVDFYFLPHLNSEYFPKMRKENIEVAILGMNEKVYAMDDNSALKIIDGKVKIVTEGKYLEYN